MDKQDKIKTVKEILKTLEEICEKDIKEKLTEYHKISALEIIKLSIKSYEKTARKGE